MTEGTWNQIISTLGAIILGIVAAKGSGHVTASETAAAAASTTSCARRSSKNSPWRIHVSGR